MDLAEPTTAELLGQLVAVRTAAVAAEDRHRELLDATDADHLGGAVNLVHYLALRDVDLRAAQRGLARRGLSSLGRAEAHILATLDAVIARLADDLVRESGAEPGTALPAVPDDLGQRGPRADQGRLALVRHADEALGQARSGGDTRVMVTMPSEAADDPALVDELVDAGMTVARINGAHDHPDAWRAMAANVRLAARRHGRTVRIAFDLAGPKLRTGPVDGGPPVVRIRPTRDRYGRVVEPARLRLCDAAHDDASQPDAVTVTPSIIHAARIGDTVRLRDARDRRRTFDVVDVHPRTVDLVGDRTTYLPEGTDLTRHRDGTPVADGQVVAVPPSSAFLDVGAGDVIRLHLGDVPGRPATRDSDGAVVEPASIGVDVPEFFAGLGVGDRVLFDDGTITTTVVEAGPTAMTVEVLRPARARLRAEKGINVPDVSLPIEALTDDDLAALEVAVEFTDMVAFSYVGGTHDVESLHVELDRLGADHVGVVLKIEHRTAFERLPQMLLHALRRPPAAVMVARGDLAVELGYERLAEVQEEILWLCEAAHVPVIWATQVLESLAKHGAPTRAEVTDAAWSSRAECVMLNKGPYMADTIRFLDDILTRMGEHQSKRTPMLRRLSVASSLSMPSN